MICPKCYEDSIYTYNDLAGNYVGCTNCDFSTSIDKDSDISRIFINTYLQKVTVELGRNAYLREISDEESPYKGTIQDRWWLEGWRKEKEETEKNSSFFSEKRMIEFKLSNLKYILRDILRQKYILGKSYRDYFKKIGLMGILDEDN